MEKKKITQYFLLFLLTLLSGCLEEIQLDYRTEEGILVVDGLITNEPPPYSISLSYTGIFESTRRPPDETVVTGAKVTVTDDDGGEVEFFQVPEKGGLYLTRDFNYRGIQGRTYTLKIILPDGRIYVSAPEKLLPVSEIDSISSEFANIPNTYHPDGLRVFVEIPEEEINSYYRWSASSIVIKKDNCFVYNFGQEIPILDRRVEGKSIKRQEIYFSPLYTVGPQYLEVAQYSLTLEAYQFWKLFNEQRNRTGSIFDPIPSPVQGNVSNPDDPNDIALGFFGASSVSRKRTILGFYDKNKLTPYTESIQSPENCVQKPKNW